MRAANRRIQAKAIAIKNDTRRALYIAMSSGAALLLTLLMFAKA
jgi:hypothetical protein